MAKPSPRLSRIAALPEGTPRTHPRGPWTARRCMDSCNGWGIYNAGEIQRCDDCARFHSDAGAAEHVAVAYPRLIRAARLALADLQDIAQADGADESPAMLALRAALKLATGQA